MGTEQSVVLTNALALAGGAAYLELAPLRGLTGAGLGVQLWLRPHALAGRCRWLDLGSGPNGERLALVYDGDKHQLSLELTLGGDLITAVRGDRELAPDRWVHVTASLAPDGAATLHLDGEPLAEARDPALTPDRLRPLLNAPVLTRCLVGRQELVKKQVAYTGFIGALAELRVWSRPLKSGDREAWRTRARGDEPGLLVCHRLDDAEPATLLDHGPRRAHARGFGARTTNSDLPLSIPHDPAGPHLQVRAGLVREHLPLAMFPADRALVPAVDKSPDRRRGNAEAYGDIDGDRVLCSVYEIFVVPRRAGAGVSNSTLEIRVDAAVLAVVDSDGDGLVELAAWSPGRTMTLPVPASGQLRLRLLAGDSLDCPTVRMHGSGLPADVWYAARPAELVHASLRAQTGDDLLRPAPGKRSPLPPGTSPEDADALADLLVQIASGLSAPDEGNADLSFAVTNATDGDDDALQSFGIGKWIKKTANDVADGVEDAADDVADTARDVAKSAAKISKQASKFVVRNAKDTGALLAKAAKVSPQFGRAAVRDCIRDAASLAVATIKDGAAWRTISLVGTRLIDGVEQCWRVVVSGVDDLIATIGAFFERIGASLRALVDFLATLFDWQRFLRASDRIYEVARRSLDSYAGALDGKIAGLFEQIEKFAAAPLQTELADQTLGQALGVRRGDSVPVIHEIDVMVDHLQRLFSSKHAKADGADGVARDPKVDPAAAQSAAAATGALVPDAAMNSPDGILDLPVRPLLALPLQAWQLAAPVIKPVVSGLVESAAAITKGSARLVTTRIDVPWLTDMIEATILRGRKLDLLRIVSLLAAIPSVLIEVGEQLVSFGGGGDDEVSRDLRWLLFSTSLTNSLIIVARAFAERGSNEPGLSAPVVIANTKRLGLLLLFNGAIAGIQAGANIALADTLRGSTAVYARLACTMDCLSAAWYGFYGGLCCTVPILGPLWAECDQCVEITLGLVTLLLAIVAAADNQAADAQVQVTLSFRVTNWVTKAVQKIADGLDNHYPKAAIVSIAAGFVLVALDLGEGAYYLATLD